MAQCPFCHAPVTETLVRHGGNCPTCLHDIPGEEAPTHPGDEAMAEIRKADVAHARKRANKPLMIALPLVVVALIGVGWALRPGPPMEKLEFGADEFAFQIDGSELVAEADPPPSQAAPLDAKAPVRPRKDGGRLTDGGSVDGALGSGPAVPTGEIAQGSAEPTATGTRRADLTPATGDRAPAGLGTASGGGAAAAPSSLDVAFTTRRTAAVLESSEDIQAAIKDMLRARVPRLKQCYERSLKTNEDLRGSWRMSFTLGKDGAVKNATAAGGTMHDATFEACLVNELSAWAILGQINREFGPVGFPVQFGAE